MAQIQKIRLASHDEINGGNNDEGPEIVTETYEEGGGNGGNDE